MVTIKWTEGRGWHDGQLVPYGPLSIDPATNVLHYAQEIFEGLKAYRQPDGTVATFRPEANAKRFQRSARRLAMPELPVETFIEACDVLVQQDKAWVPAHGGEESLYLRPFMIASEVGLGVKPANEYLFIVIASPAGAYFPGGVKPVSIWLSEDRVRAVPGGMGDAKTGGNYAASLLAQAEAAAKGCDQVAYLDAVEHKWVEELGGMNLYFVYGDKIVTPELTGSLLAGVTRDSLLPVARDLGYESEEGRVSIDQWQRRHRERHPHRGLRLRHRRRHHPRRHRQVRGRRVDPERRRARRGHDEAARPAPRRPARYRGGHPRLDAPARVIPGPVRLRPPRQPPGRAKSFLRAAAPRTDGPERTAVGTRSRGALRRFRDGVDSALFHRHGATPVSQFERRSM